MYKKLFYGLMTVIVIAVLGLGGLVFAGKKTSASPQTKPWVEVVSNSAWLLDKTTKEPTDDLVTGDQVEAGDIIATNNSGFANVYFPDGSVFRMEPNSEVVVSEGAYDSESEDVTAKLKVTAGRIWCKIFDLATTKSTWQVETTNAVATVRGTAFGLEAINGNTVLIGSEHDVDVQLKDPQTGQAIPDVVLKLIEGKFTTITDAEIEQVKKDKNYLPNLLKDLTPDLLNADWVKRGTGQDEYFDKIRSDLEARYPDKKEFRKEVRKYWQDKFRDDLAKQRRLGKSKVYRFLVNLQEQVAAGVETVNPTTGTNTTKPGTTPPPSSTPPSTTPPPTQAPTPVRINVLGFSNTSSVTAGQSLYFRAIVTFSDGTQQNVTDQATWSADSSIGSMNGPGVLVVPPLGQSRTVTGAIRASWKTPSGSMMNTTSTVQLTYNYQSPNTKP